MPSFRFNKADDEIIEVTATSLFEEAEEDNNAMSNGSSNAAPPIQEDVLPILG